MELNPAPRAGNDGRSGRGTFRGETVFFASALRLVATLVLEVIYNISLSAVFLFLRNSYREKMRGIVLGGARAAALLFPILLATALAGAGGGCSPQKSDKPVDPRSFKGQLRDLGWSVRALADQSDAKRSLEDDLEAFGTDPNWKEDLRFSARSMFLMEDAKKSLEFDLKAMGDPDHKKHGLKETFEMWGF